MCLPTKRLEFITRGRRQVALFLDNSVEVGHAGGIGWLDGRRCPDT
ncbi:MAG: hypothetical protein Ct9H300mP11_21920 [Chloroflexota bacterium]|nr:MAG: hypothetical protein Ct9H300mP11_21920 [Chloroflexota bacterium]